MTKDQTNIFSKNGAKLDRMFLFSNIPKNDIKNGNSERYPKLFSGYDRYSAALDAGQECGRSKSYLKELLSWSHTT